MPPLTVLALAILALDDPPAPRLTMTPAVACAKIEGFGDYEPLEEAVLTKDDKLLLYLEPKDYALAPAGKKGPRIHLVEDVRIRRRGEKKVLWSKAKLLEYKPTKIDPAQSVYLEHTIALKMLTPGEYDLDITLNDEIAKGPPATQVVKFRVKAAEAKAAKPSDAPKS